MSSSTLVAGIRQLRSKLAQQCRQDESDEQLLHAFTSRRDDSAFAALVRRHGAMVLHVCRRVLGHEQDAEDAFQATFLVLARHASTLCIKTTLAGFLHGTAYRTAMKAKQSAARRRKHEGQTPARPAVDLADELSWREVRTLLDEEIARLPENYRGVFVLCYLENLSQVEASRRLGLNERTVSNRLATARKRLAKRLARRGVELTAVLAATGLAVQSASALPAGLMAATSKAASAMAAGEGPAAIVSASVASLLKNSSSILTLGKAKLATLLLTVGLLGGGAWVRFHAAAAVERDDPPAAEKAKPQPSVVPTVKEDKENAAYAGRVLDPDGKPVAGAKLYLLYYTPKDLPIPVRAASDKDGQFRFTVARKDFDQSASVRPWDEAIVVATANGYGLGLSTFQPGRLPMRTDWNIRLPKDDVPITGRLLDLQGKPVAGVTVGVHGLFSSAKEDLTAWLRDLKEKKEGYPALRAHLTGLEGTWMGRDVGKILSPAVTGDDGRFRLTGIGRERVVALRIQGPSIATTELNAMTRPGDTIRVASWQRGDQDNEMTFCGSTFEHIAAPGQTIVGVVRDKDTGTPVPGAVVESYIIAGPRARYVRQTIARAVTDNEGRYRLTGMPKGKGNAIRASGPDGQPYLMSLADVPEGFALKAVNVDFRLKRGVWIHGKVTEKATGKPVQSVIRCAVHQDNPFRREASGLTFEDNMWTNADGSFRFAGLPGRSVVMAQTGGGSHFLSKVGADRIKDLNRFNLFQLYNAVVEINPDKDAKEVQCDLILEAGQTLNGKVVDSEGRPVSGARVAGLGQTGNWENQPLRSAEFTVLALRPDETRLLQFAHAEKHLAGSLVVRGDAKGPLTVTLKRAGTLKGRFVTPDGKPLADLTILADLYGPIADPRMMKAPQPTIGTFPQGLRTDKDGKFHIDDLAPGLKYRILLLKGRFALMLEGPARAGVTVEEGEMKDLGDVTVKRIE